MPEMLSAAQIPAAVNALIDRQPIVDMHTHLYPPTFGTPLAGKSAQADTNGLMLWGVDELLTYHYLVAEVFRAVPPSQLSYEAFWNMPRRDQADHIWKNLFIDRAPISESCRGVLTTIQKLGLDPSDPTPDRWREFCAAQHPGDYIDRVMNAANVRSITMTNNVFDDNERNRWLKDASIGNDPRFRAVLRIDPLLCDWPAAAKKLAAWGYITGDPAEPSSIETVRRFLREWLDRIKAIYVALSLPPEWRYPANAADDAARDGQTILEQAILPVCAERNLPFAMMIGATRAANPALRDAGDMLGQSDVQSVVNLCRAFPQNRFFVTMLSRENQHALAVAARKFGNLMPFGCWWFLNNPSLIEETTRLRIELLGTSFIPQHSDARILDQLIYKWTHSRAVIGKVLTEKFLDLAATGRAITHDEIDKTIRLFFAENFESFCRGS